MAEVQSPPEGGSDGVLARLEHLQHWWREPIAGAVAVGIGTYDAWKFPKEIGLSPSLDEILILTGIALIAGIRNLFGSKPPPPQKPE